MEPLGQDLLDSRTDHLRTETSLRTGDLEVRDAPLQRARRTGPAFRRRPSAVGRDTRSRRAPAARHRHERAPPGTGPPRHSFPPAVRPRTSGRTARPRCGRHAGRAPRRAAGRTVPRPRRSHRPPPVDAAPPRREVVPGVAASTVTAISTVPHSAARRKPFMPPSFGSADKIHTIARPGSAPLLLASTCQVWQVSTQTGGGRGLDSRRDARCAARFLGCGGLAPDGAGRAR